MYSFKLVKNNVVIIKFNNIDIKDLHKNTYLFFKEHNYQINFKEYMYKIL